MRTFTITAVVAVAIGLGGCAYDSLQSDREQAQAARDQATQVRDDAARERDEIDAALDSVAEDSAAAEALRAERERVQAVLVAADEAAQELEAAIEQIDISIAEAEADKDFWASTVETLGPLIPIPGGAAVAASVGFWLRRSGRQIGARDVTESIRIGRASSEELNRAFEQLDPAVKEWMNEKLPGYVAKTVNKYKSR